MYALQEMRPGREPHWFGRSRPLEWTIAESLTVMTGFSMFDTVLRSTVMRKKAAESYETFSCLIQDYTVGVLW